MGGDPAERLWTPSPARVAAAGLTRYLRWLEAERGLRFDGYEELWRWSVADLEAFWASVWDFCGVAGHRRRDRVLGDRRMPGARWFEGATLNYAEQALRHAARPGFAERPALVVESESRPRREVTWAELARQVGALSRTLERLGVGQGDRVAAYLPSVPEAAVGLLAAAAGGAVWSSCSPEMGPVSVLDRLRQIEPAVLLAVDGYRYGGRDHDRRATVEELVRHLPSLRAVVLVPHLDPGASLAGLRVPVIPYDEAVAGAAAPRVVPVPFDHPLWIVYSSGTSGLPKPIVHGHGGVVLESAKAAALHLDVAEDDRFCWYTSTSWIMWNIWVSTLARGCTALQLDGSPVHPDPGTLWSFAARERASFLGVSPAFLASSMKAGVRPRRSFDLSALRTLGATGAPLPPEAYRWVHEEVGADVMLASISGGTDVCAAFLTSCPTLPIYPGEMQCRGLGVAVESWDDAARPLVDEVGELVVTAPMPSMPLGFWGDADGRRYRESYFETFPGVWRHGDWIRLVPRAESVTAVIYGRSDATINRHGIRMGTAELYRVVEAFPEVADALVVDLEHLGGPSFLALFVVLTDPGLPQVAGGRGPAPDAERAGRASGGATDDAAATGVPLSLRTRLLEELRRQLSARHVPDAVFAVPEVPRTLSGKKMEVPVKRILLGHPPERCASRDAMANPSALDWFVAFARARAAVTTIRA